MKARVSASESNPETQGKSERFGRTVRTVNRRDGKNDGPAPNVFASTAGRAVSRRSKVGLRVSGFAPPTEHFQRISTTPAYLPFKSTSFATYPVPPQFGKSSGSTRLHLRIESIVHDAKAKFSRDALLLRITNKNSRFSASARQTKRPDESAERQPRIIPSL